MLTPSPRRAVLRRWGLRFALNESGFSALESMIVVTLLGVVMGMSVSGMRHAVAGERVDGWVRTMTYDIAAARQAALTRRTTVTVSIAGQTYTIRGARGGAPRPGGPPPPFPAAGQPSPRGAAGGAPLRRAALPADITLATTCPAGACSFDRRGVPTAWGTISLPTTRPARPSTSA